MSKVLQILFSDGYRLHDRCFCFDGMVRKALLRQLLRVEITLECSVLVSFLKEREKGEERERKKLCQKPLQPEIKYPTISVNDSCG